MSGYEVSLSIFVSAEDSDEARKIVGELLGNQDFIVDYVEVSE